MSLIVASFSIACVALTNCTISRRPVDNSSGNVADAISSDGHANPSVASRAIRSFSHVYGDCRDAQWSPMKDGGFICRFTKKSIPERAFYDAKGNWLYSIGSYGEDKLAKDIRTFVRNMYQDYKISFVNEIDLPLDRKVYLIQVENEETLKIVRIGDDRIETLQEITLSSS
jgi:hypothetical protein